MVKQTKQLLAEIFEVPYESITESDPIRLRVDSQAALAITRSEVGNTRTKHFDLKLFFARECFQKKVIDPVYIPSKRNTANAFTKPVLKDELQRLVSVIPSS